MTPVFVNSAMVRVSERLMLAGGRWQMIDLKVRFGFLDHPTEGPVLIDTGYSTRIKQGSERSFALKTYNAITRPRLKTEAISFLATRGIAPSDIRSIIVTHFHADHVSALRDFPNAKIYANGSALHKIKSTSHLANVRHGVFTELLPDDIEGRLAPFDQAAKVDMPGPFGKGFDVFGDGSAVCVSLPGHASGHCGVWFGQAETQFLYATDVQWMRRGVTQDAAPKLLSSIVCDDRQASRESVARLLTYQEQGGEFLLCHDPQDSDYDHQAAE